MEPTTQEIFLSTSNDELDLHKKQSLDFKIIKTGSIIVIFLASFGNTLTILTVLSRKVLRALPSSVYLVLLAILDLLTMYIALGIPKLLLRYGIDITVVSVASCKFQTFIIYYATEVEAWILVNMSLERLVAVTLPHHYKQLFSKKRVAIGLLISGLVLFLVNLTWMDSATIMPKATDPDEVFCRTAPDDLYFVFSTVDLVLCSLLPFALMLSINTVIIITMKYKGMNNISKKVTNITIMLMTVTFSFFILTAPLVIYFLTELNNYYVFQTFYVMYISNYSVNFFLYCLSGPKFRAEFVAMLVAAKLYPKSNVVGADSNNSSWKTNETVHSSVSPGAS